MSIRLSKPIIVGDTGRIEVYVTDEVEDQENSTIVETEIDLTSFTVDLLMWLDTGGGYPDSGSPTKTFSITKDPDQVANTGEGYYDYSVTDFATAGVAKFRLRFQEGGASPKHSDSEYVSVEAL